jgi:hypothetical protein
VACYALAIEEGERKQMTTRRYSFQRSLVSALVLGGCLDALAVVSGSRAGSVGATFDVFVQPPILTAGAAGFVKGEFTAATGPASGTATHVVMTLDLPVALLNPASSNCSQSGSPPAGFNRFTCDIGTVKAGKTATRYVTFTAPSTSGTYTANGSVNFDQGSSGAKGGGSQNTTLTKSGQTSVFSPADTTRAGSCTGSAATQPEDQVGSNPTAQTTSVSATADPSLALPCTWVYVGENPPPPDSGILTQISFVGIPPTTTPATVVITFASLPVPFADFELFFLPNYSPGNPDLTGMTLLKPCSETPVPPALSCLQSLVPMGEGAQATILLMGTGGDPGWGAG